MDLQNLLNTLDSTTILTDAVGDQYYTPMGIMDSFPLLMDVEVAVLNENDILLYNQDDELLLDKNFEILVAGSKTAENHSENITDFLNNIVQEKVKNIKNWNCKNVHHLLGMIESLKATLSSDFYHNPQKIEEVFNTSDLNFAKKYRAVLAKISDFPVWTIDEQGFCLVGSDMSKITSVKDISDWY